jgi:hypothetical protein
MNINRRKKKIIDKYGLNPTICYYYYLWNVVDYCGEERVRQSFESLHNQGNEVILGCYLPTDKTKEIAKEYGFKVIEVEEDPRSKFPESKIRNKVILESKSNFLVPVNINVEYSKRLTGVIKSWIKDNDITKTALKIKYNFESSDGVIGRKGYGFSYVFYRPYLLYVRGYDERTSYAAGSQKYGVRLLQDIYKLRTSNYNSSMYHKYHNDVKLPMMHKIFPNHDLVRLKRTRGQVVNTLINNLNTNFPRNIANVKNSYW